MISYKVIFIFVSDLFFQKYGYNFGFLKRKGVKEGKWLESFFE